MKFVGFFLIELHKEMMFAFCSDCTTLETESVSVQIVLPLRLESVFLFRLFYTWDRNMFLFRL